MPKKTPTAAKATAKAVKAVPLYTATIHILGKKYTAEGQTVREALSNLQPGGAAKVSAVISVSNGKKSKDRVLTPFSVNRLFSPSPLTREIALKNTSLLFDL